MQLTPPSATPYAPQAPQESPMLAQALAAMRAPQPQTATAASANMVADALNNFGQQGAGQGGAGQWTGVDGKPSGNWFDSPLGSQVGGLFGLGKNAPAVQQGSANAAQMLSGGGVMPAGY